MTRFVLPAKALSPAKLAKWQGAVNQQDYTFFAKVLGWIRQGISLKSELANQPEALSFFKESLTRYCQTKQGWVYGSYNPVLPGLAKIGFSKKTVKARMKSLSGTAIPAEYNASSAVFVYDAPFFEKVMHARLARCRVSKEFFSISCSELEREFDLAYQEHCHDFLVKTGVSINIIAK